jgi:Ca-activated chloride channel homolog
MRIVSSLYRPLFTLSFAILWLSAAGQEAVQTRSEPGPGGGQTRANRQVLVMFNNKAGAPLIIPAKDDVQLKLGGKPAVIEQVLSLQNMPLYFSVVVDVSGSTRDIAKLQSSLGAQLFEQLSHEGSHGHLVLFNSRASASNRFLTGEEGKKELLEFPITSRYGPTALYDAIEVAVTRQLENIDVPPHSRRAIVLLTDGEDNSSRLSLDKIVKEVKQSNIPIVAVGFWTAGPPLRDQGRGAIQGSKAIKKLCEETGGLVVDATEANLAEKVAGLLRTQSRVEFSADELKDGKWYSLKFEIGDKEAHILAPKEYFAVGMTP